MKQFDLGYGSFGNGLCVWNRARMTHGDFEHVAHIQPEGLICWYDDFAAYMPEAQREEIHRHARRMAKEFKQSFLHLNREKAVKMVYDAMTTEQFLKKTVNYDAPMFKLYRVYMTVYAANMAHWGYVKPPKR